MNRNYSVFYKNGDEANESYLNSIEAMCLAHDLESEGYEVVVACLENNVWKTTYETPSNN